MSGKVLGSPSPDEKIERVRLDHLGLAAQMAEDIGLIDTIDACVGGVDSREILSTGQAIQAIAINCLGYTSRPLQLTPQFFRTRDIKFLLGPNRGRANVVLTPDHLNEHRLGRALDVIAEAGPEKIFMSIAFNAFRKEGVKVPNLHMDTTTHSFYGQYVDKKGDPRLATFKSDVASDEPVEIKITHGYSKDSREHCKQIVQELLVSSDGDVPLMMKAYSGNAADVSIFQDRIKRIKQAFIDAKAEDLLPEYTVADCKFYSEDAVTAAHNDGLKFITRVPENILEVKAPLSKALNPENKDKWVNYCKDSEGEKVANSSLYEVVVSKYNVQQKYIVVKSDAKMALAAKNSIKVVAKEDALINRTINKLKKQNFYCENDLKSAIKLAFENLKFHIIEENTFESAVKYDSKGRPNKDSQSKTIFNLASVIYKIDTDAVTKFADLNSCFVLGTNDLNANSARIVDIYRKDQQGVERSFRFLKDPQYFADAFFLKNPNRVIALVTVMTIALLLYSLLQRRLRLNLKKLNKELPNQNRKGTSNPTIRWVNMNFEGVDVTVIHRNNKVEYFFHDMLDFVQRTLDALGDKYVRRYSIDCLT